MYKYNLLSPFNAARICVCFKLTACDCITYQEKIRYYSLHNQ